MDVGGQTLHINSMGEGSPVVVLEAGAGGTSLDWAHVQSALAKGTRVCAYDRAGLGWSESGLDPRTIQQLVEELHTLLRESGEKPPYLLVGHSFGGMVMKYYAAVYPNDVAGLVLVDGIHEDFFSQMPSQVSDGIGAQLKMLSMGRIFAKTGLPRLLMPPLAARGLPEDIQPAANALGYRGKVYKTVHDEAQNFETSAALLRKTTSFPNDIPVTILSRTKAEQWPSNVDADEAEAIWQDLQTAHLAISEKATHISVEDSGHYIQIEQPEAVIKAITDMLEEIKN